MTRSTSVRWRTSADRSLVYAKGRGASPAFLRALGRLTGVGITSVYTTAAASSLPWTPSNVPWSDLTESQYVALWPTPVTIVDLNTSSSDFYGAAQATMSPLGNSKAVIRLPESPTTNGQFVLNQFRMIGTSNDPLYAKSLWLPNLLGFLGKGVTKTTILQAPNSTYPAGWAAAAAAKTTASNYELQTGMIRLDGLSPSTPVSLAGLTFRGSDQANITSVASDVPAVMPQPAPYNGVEIFGGSWYQVNNIRLQASAHAMTSRGPYELGNIKTGKAFGTMQGVESDGQLAAEVNPARPRRSTVIMENDEHYHELIDFWGHHTNVSRYAANDQLQTYGPDGVYITTRAQFDHIADLQNVDPALNGGISLDGFSDPSDMGWESTTASITLNQPYLQVDNPNKTRNTPCHISLTTTAGNTHGTIRIYGGTYRNFGWPSLDGYLTMKCATSTAWYTAGFDNTIFVYNAAGVRMTPLLTTQSWPYTLPVGVSPDTHFIVKTN